MVVAIGGMVDRKVVVGGIKMKMFIVVIGEVHRITTSVADDEELHKA